MPSSSIENKFQEFCKAICFCLCFALGGFCESMWMTHKCFDFFQENIEIVSSQNKWSFLVSTWSEKVELLSNYRRFPSLSKINRKWKCEFSIEAKSIEKGNFHWKRHFMCLNTISILQKINTLPHLRPQKECFLLYPQMRCKMSLI